MTSLAKPPIKRIAEILNFPVRRRITKLRNWRVLELYGTLVVVLYAVAIILAPVITHYDPIAQDFSSRIAGPSAAHLFGTDQLGRDQFSRILYGGRTSVALGLLIVVLGGSVGTMVGALAGFFGGIVDEVLMRIADVFLSFPSIMLAMVVAASLGPSLQNAAIAVAVAWWPWYARIVRGQVISVRDRDFVTATRTLGASELRILFRTVLPNSLNVVRVVFVLDLGFAIIAGSTLSFLGLGVSPPTPEWGLMIRDAMQHTEAWWMMAFPGLAIMLLVSALNFGGGVVTRTLAERYVR